MSPTKPKNVAASVRQKLTNLSKQRGEEFQFILSERLLYRISRSKHSERFVLRAAGRKLRKRLVLEILE